MKDLSMDMQNQLLEILGLQTQGGHEALKIQVS